MSEIFSKILRLKKVFIFPVLVLVLTGATIPKIVTAAQEDPMAPYRDQVVNTAGLVGPDFSISNSCTTPEGQRASLSHSYDPKTDFGFVGNIAIGIGYFLSALTYGIVKVVMYLFSVISASVLNLKITSGFSADVWARVRDLANMLIVLGFVFIGIATALRVREYEAKKFLLPLIIVALLINFSGLFVGLIIDASNLTTNGLNSGGQSPYDTMRSMANTISCTMNNLLYNAWTQKNVYLLLAYYGMGIAMWFVFLAAVIVAAVVLTERYVILTMLFILSPLAFAFWAVPFPKAKELWSKWWSYFIKWCFVGIGITFSFFLAAQTLAAGKIFPDAGLRLFFAICFIIIGVRMTAKSTGLAAMASTAVMGLATGGAGLAMGALAGGAKLSGLTGMAQRGGQAIQRGTTRVGERLGLVAPGRANLMRQEHLKQYETEKRADTWSADQRRDIATGRAVTARQRNDKVEAIKQMASKAELGRLTVPQRAAAVAYATSHGESIKKLSEDDYRAAEFDTGPTGRVTALGGGVAGAQRARAERLEANISKMSGQQIRDIDTRDITPELITSQVMNAGIIRQFRTADAARIANFGTRGVGPAGTPGTINAAVDAQLTATIAAAAAAGNVNEQRRLASVRSEIMRTLQAP